MKKIFIIKVGETCYVSDMIKFSNIKQAKIFSSRKECEMAIIIISGGVLKFDKNQYKILQITEKEYQDMSLVCDILE